MDGGSVNKAPLNFHSKKEAKYRYKVKNGCLETSSPILGNSAGWFFKMPIFKNYILKNSESLFFGFKFRHSNETIVFH